jgi:hypothetical protein
MVIARLDFRVQNPRYVGGMPLEYSDNVLHDPEHNAIGIRIYAPSPISCE